jgi:hypothetical protein
MGIGLGWVGEGGVQGEFFFNDYGGLNHAG